MFDSNKSCPIGFTYVDKISHWWPPQKIAAGIGVPGFAQPTIYNYFAFAFWSCKGALDIAKLWSEPLTYFGADSIFGNTAEEIQQNIKKRFHQKGIKLLVSAFGGTEEPTSANIDPVCCATELAKFVIQNNFDGVDVDWEDNAAMNSGKGQQWIIKFQLKLRELLPHHIITHAPQAPYFSTEAYKNGGYTKIHQKVGHTINFYNIQFYNQGNTQYNTFQTLFLKSGSYFPGTSVKQIIDKGIPANKIVIGKPVTQGDVANTGLVNHEELGKWMVQANHNFKWHTGVMYWQYSSDINGKAIQSSMGYFKNKI